MSLIPHKFTDSLSQFLSENPEANERDWLKKLDEDDLSLLVELLKIIVQGRGVIGLSKSECINTITDAHLLAFKVSNIGKKRKILNMKPERRIKVIANILAYAQLMMINRRII